MAKKCDSKKELVRHSHVHYIFYSLLGLVYWCGWDTHQHDEETELQCEDDTISGTDVTRTI